MRLIFLSAILFTIVGCNDNNQNSTPESNVTVQDSVVETAQVNQRVLPKTIGPLIMAHGGLERWEQMQNLCFEIEKPSGTEVHSTDLKSRKTRIEHQDWVIGFDGEQVWLDQEEEVYKGNARFYHNLYFYFYAMPFILTDPGIQYAELSESLEIDGKKYRGTLISYNAGVGDSPKDEYILYRDPETNKMAWLAYTVTFMDNQKKDSFNFIKYNSWQEVNGLVLPQELVWYQVEDGKPVAPASSLTFNKVSVTESKLDNSLFVKPAGAEVIPR